MVWPSSTKKSSAEATVEVKRRKESQATLDLYGPDVMRPGSFARNCLLARRMVERDVRFVQLYHRGWDQHNTLPKRIREQSLDTDQPSAALITDLKQRGLLEDTLVIWGGEFGRKPVRDRNATDNNPGRDHNAKAFTTVLAGGGVRGGMVYGATDEFGAASVENKVHIHDLHATILALLGFDHQKLTYRYNGRDFRLTDVSGEVVKAVVA